MEQALLILAVSISNIVCLIIGAKIMQKSNKEEEIRLPELNPMKAWEKRREEKELKRQMEAQEILAANIEAYDGTSRGQRDVEVSEWI